MIDYIDAPMPFIIGVPRNIWKAIKHRKESFPPEVIRFDIDKNKLVCNEKLPDLPPKAAESVYKILLNIMDEKERIRKILKNVSDQKHKVKIKIRIAGRVLGRSNIETEAIIP